MEQIAIIYTTFLRNELAFKTIQSIQPLLSENVHLFIGDQNRRENRINKNPNWHFTSYYELPFDCGLSFARNYLVQMAQINHYQYCVITADSIEFTPPYDFKDVIEFMSTDSTIAKIGLKLNNRVLWEFNLRLEDVFILECSNDYVIYNQQQYHKVDICKNFFLARTDALIKVPWDNELKLLEHEDHCWRLKQAGYKTFTTDAISANYINNKPQAYKVYRERMYNEYMNKLKEKYHLTQWIKYGEGVLDEIRKGKT